MKAFLVALLVSVGLLATMGLISTASVDLGEDGSRLLGSLAILTAFVAFGLASVAALEGGPRLFLGAAGLVASPIGLALSVWAVWSEPSSERFFRTWGTITLSAFVLAFACLLLLIRRSHPAVVIVVAVSLASLALGWVAALAGIWGVVSGSEGFGRFLTALGIVAVFGGLAAPMLNGLVRRR